MDNRRNFIKKTAAGSVGLAAGSMLMPNSVLGNVLGASDKLQVAVIGVRSRAKGLISSINQIKNVNIKYSVDVDKNILKEHNAWCEKNIGYVPKNETDFRKVLDDKDIDAIFVVTPEHWHAPMAIAGMQAGKHVYVEKPCSHNLFENDLIVKVQKKTGMVCQMGNQQRSGKSSIQAIQEIREGVIGDVYKGEAYYNSNRESIGKGKVVPVPDYLDWELFQGPAPREEYRDNIHPYNWHWFRTWGTGEIHNNGTHEIDVCRWALGVDIPKTVSAFGGKYTYDDDWEYADNTHAVFTYDDGKFITWNGHSRGKMQPNQPGRGITIYGSKGVMTLSRNEYRLFDLGGKQIKEVTEAAKSGTVDKVGGGILTTYHIQNFFDGIRMGSKLNAPIADGAISSMHCHLGTISQDLGRTLNINPKNGEIFDDDEAMSFWKREYEPGWEPKL